MIRDDEIRRRLRAADPAAGRDLTPAERTRLKAFVTSAARRTPHPRVFPFLATGAAIATIVAAVLLLAPRAERPAGVPSPATTRVEVPTAPVVVDAPRPSPVAATRRPRAAAERSRPRPAVLTPSGPPTRIVFTAPEGTRILWFVETRDEKELGS